MFQASAGSSIGNPMFLEQSKIPLVFGYPHKVICREEVAHMRAPRLDTEHTERHMVLAPLGGIEVAHRHSMNAVSILAEQWHLEDPAWALLAVAVEDSIRVWQRVASHHPRRCHLLGLPRDSVILGGGSLG